MDVWSAIGLGLVAGFAIAVPVGAIGVLLIQEGATRGLLGGAPAALAVGLVDLLYSAAAVTAGSVIAPTLADWHPWPRVLGGTALVALAVWGFLGVRSTASAPGTEVVVRRSPGWQRAMLFFALTAINPATIIYFAAVVTGLSGVAETPETAAGFVGAVGTASVTWALMLVIAGSIVRRTTGERGRRITQAIGFGVVAVLGALMVGSAFT